MQTTYESTCVKFFNAKQTQNKIAEKKAKFHKFWYRVALVCTKTLKSLPKYFFPEIPCKNLDWIWDETRPISGQRDEYSPGKKIKQFHTQTNIQSSPGSDEQKMYCESCGTNLGLKSHSKLNRHNEESLVKFSDQNTQGIRRSKSQTENEQNWFSENKTSWLFFPVSSFCDLFMNLPPYLGANNIWKNLCKLFQRKTDP